MNWQNDWKILLNLYLDGELTKEEEKNAKQLLQNHPRAQAYFQDLLYLRQQTQSLPSLPQLTPQQLQQQLQQLQLKLQKNSPHSLSLYYPSLLKIAATLLLSTLLWFSLKPTSTSPHSTTPTLSKSNPTPPQNSPYNEETYQKILQRLASSLPQPNPSSAYTAKSLPSNDLTEEQLLQQLQEELHQNQIAISTLPSSPSTPDNSSTSTLKNFDMEAAIQEFLPNEDENTQNE